MFPSGEKKGWRINSFPFLSLTRVCCPVDRSFSSSPCVSVTLHNGRACSVSRGRIVCMTWTRHVRIRKARAYLYVYMGMECRGVHVRPLNANDVLSWLELEIVTFTVRFSMLYELFLASLSSFLYLQFQACFNTNVCNWTKQSIKQSDNFPCIWTIIKIVTNLPKRTWNLLPLYSLLPRVPRAIAGDRQTDPTLCPPISEISTL